MVYRIKAGTPVYSRDMHFVHGFWKEDRETNEESFKFSTVDDLLNPREPDDTFERKVTLVTGDYGLPFWIYSGTTVSHNPLKDCPLFETPVGLFVDALGVSAHNLFSDEYINRLIPDETREAIEKYITNRQQKDQYDQKTFARKMVNNPVRAVPRDLMKFVLKK